MSLAIALACLAVGAVMLWHRRRTASLPQRLLLALLLPGAIVTAAVACDHVATAPGQVWNDIRLAPAAALLRGYELYYLPGDGPMLGHIYGPVAPLLYLPAAMLPTPSAAIRAGSALTLAVCLLPVILYALVYRAAGLHLAGAAVLVFALFSFQSDVLHSLAFGIHVDTSAAAFAALACLPLVDAERRRHPSWLLLSAVAVLLSVGSKQVALPVAAAIPTYLWLADGRDVAVRFVRLLALCVIAVLAILAGAVDLRAMAYQILVVPAGHPWRMDDVVRAFVQTLRDFVPRVALPGAVVVAAAAAGVWQIRDWTGLRRWMRDNPWVALVIVAVLSAPMSILGRMKLGGAYATLSFSVYPLALAAVVAVLHAAATAPDQERQRPRRVAAVMFLIMLAAATLRAAPLLRPRAEVTADARADPEASGFAFVRAHPNQVYAPLNPLLSLMGDGSAYHLLLPTISEQYFGHVAAGNPAASAADDAAFAEYLPADLRYVLYPVEEGSSVTPIPAPSPQRHLDRYLREFTVVVPVAPGWAALVAERPR
jgi:hypothetical protein